MLEFSEKFRLYHPTVPEAFYGKLAKPVQNPVNTEQEANDNMSSNVATKVAEPKPFPEKEMGDKSKSNVQDAESKQMEVPKISLRRDSSDRNMWQNTTNAAETAMNGMFKAIRATFKQGDPSVQLAESANGPAAIAKKNNVENIISLTETRSSSASRGRGLAKSARNQN